MNAEQKQRAAELVSEWNTHYPEYVGDRMAALLQELIDAPAPSVPDGWRYVIPGRRRTEKFDSARIGDYNQGWNDCRKITEKALNDLEKRK